MINQKNIETLFDCFDSSASLLYETYKMPYLDGLIKTCENMISDSVEDKFQDIKSQLEELLVTIKDIEFQKEEIRKAFQYACLKGFKHVGISNQMITPDTIGIFFNYLISKLYRKDKLIILDPVIGTGNLISTIANNSNKDFEILGVDIDEIVYKLANTLLDMLGYGDKIFCQDIMSFKFSGIECIVGDFSGLHEKIVYNIIKHESEDVIDGGFLIGLFDSEVVNPEKLINYSKELNDSWNLFGMINLPANISKNYLKSIVIFQKSGDRIIKPKQFLLVELPDFTAKDEMNTVINQMNNWFKETDFNKV